MNIHVHLKVTCWEQKCLKDGFWTMIGSRLVVMSKNLVVHSHVILRFKVSTENFYPSADEYWGKLKYPNEVTTSKMLFWLGGNLMLKICANYKVHTNSTATRLPQKSGSVPVPTPVVWSRIWYMPSGSTLNWHLVQTHPVTSTVRICPKSSWSTEQHRSSWSRNRSEMTPQMAASLILVCSPFPTTFTRKELLVCISVFSAHRHPRTGFWASLVEEPQPSARSSKVLGPSQWRPWEETCPSRCCSRSTDQSLCTPAATTEAGAVLVW